MKHLTLTQKLCMAGWLAAAVLLMAVNAVPLLYLEDAPLEGDSAALRALRAQLGLWEKLTAARNAPMPDLERLERFFAAYHTSVKGAPTDASATTAGQGPAEPAQPPLPGLTGVLQRLDGRGRPYYRALLDGRVCVEKDQVRNFTVGSISAEGVTLLRAGDSWFLPSPKTYYNSDQGR